jgi:hypothetical protein
MTVVSGLRAARLPLPVGLRVATLDLLLVLAFATTVPPRSILAQRAESATMGCQLYVKNNSHATSITNKAPNSSARRRAHHQISPPCSSTVFASPPFPSHPGTSISMDRRSEGPQMTKNPCRTQMKQPNHSQRMSFLARHPAMTTD